MATITIQPERLAADSENLALSSSLDAESRCSTETATNEKTGDEEALLPPIRSSQEAIQHTSSGSHTKLLLWMLANTLATIGIVRTLGRNFFPSP